MLLCAPCIIPCKAKAVHARCWSRRSMAQHHLKSMFSKAQLMAYCVGAATPGAGAAADGGDRRALGARRLPGRRRQRRLPRRASGAPPCRHQASLTPAGLLAPGAGLSEAASISGGCMARAQLPCPCGRLALHKGERPLLE